MADGASDKYAQFCKLDSRMKDHFGCPIQATSNVLAGKWKVLIVWHLSFGSRRFAEIRDLLPGTTEKVLTDQLRQLERDGIISRHVTPTVPPRVDYQLTEAGQELIPVMEAMCGWGTKHLGVPPSLPRSAAGTIYGSARVEQA
jgi:DNA-binding HxlR family transcriptional regulator